MLCEGADTPEPLSAHPDGLESPMPRAPPQGFKGTTALHIPLQCRRSSHPCATWRPSCLTACSAPFPRVFKLRVRCRGGAECSGARRCGPKDADFYSPYNTLNGSCCTSARARSCRLCTPTSIWGAQEVTVVDLGPALGCTQPLYNPPAGQSLNNCLCCC